MVGSQEDQIEQEKLAKTTVRKVDKNGESTETVKTTPYNRLSRYANQDKNLQKKPQDRQSAENKPAITVSALFSHMRIMRANMRNRPFFMHIYADIRGLYPHMQPISDRIYATV